MFAVDNILISDDLLETQFACNLGACLGACCVHGEAGAPLEPEERQTLEQILPRVKKYLSPEALEVIERQGVWEEHGKDHYVTSCVGDGACVFVTYEGAVATCAIQRAYREGRIDYPKPISCHLYPIRVEKYGEVEVLNYEDIPLCDPARSCGERKGIYLADFLREPLIRKFGERWYDSFLEILEARRQDLGLSPAGSVSSNVRNA